jgi:hypothetical protein
MKNYLKKCLAIQNKEFAIASTFLRGKYKMRNVCRRFHKGVMKIMLKRNLLDRMVVGFTTTYASRCLSPLML